MPGEVFCMKIKNRGFMFGRVVCNNCTFGTGGAGPQSPPTGFYVVYIYSLIKDKPDDISDLSLSLLLFPPKIIVGTGWTRGYFVKIAHEPMSNRNSLPIHCFHNRVFTKYEKYVDEHEKELPCKTEPCGEWSSGNVGTIEMDIVRAMGWPEPQWWG